MKVFISIFGNLCWVLSIFWAYQKIIYQKVSFKKMCYVAIFYFGIGLVEEVLHTGEIPYYLSDLTGIDIFFFFGTWNICLVLDHLIYTIWQKSKTFNFSHRMHMLSMPADVLYSKWNALVFIKWKCTNLLFIKFANDSTVVFYDLSDCGKVEYCQNLSRIWV